MPSRVGGTPEVVAEGTGILVPASDRWHLAEALRALAASPATRTALGEAGRARVVERFSIERMVAEYLDVYRRAARS